MVKISFLLLSLLGAIVSFSQNITVQGDVHGLWDYDTVFVAGDLEIRENNELNILSGCRVEFLGHYELQVKGRLVASGSLDAPVVFDIADTTGFHIDSIPDGSWNGIRFYNTKETTESSVLMLCRFEHAKAVDSLSPAGNCGGALCVVGYDSLLVEKCTFENNFASFNGGAIYADSSDIKVHYCDFINNRCGKVVFPWGYGGAVCFDNSSPDVFGNYFENNSSTGVGGGVAMRFKEGPMNNNVFTENYSGLGGAFGLLHMDENPFSHCNNLIYNNQAEFFGGGIANLNASPFYSNNTLVYNYATYGGGFYCKDSVTPNVYNSILWGNSAAVGPQVYLFEPYSQVNFAYCDVEGGPELFGGSGGGAGYVGYYENNIDLDPEFDVQNGGPYALGGSSPCIDAGRPDTSGLQVPEHDLIGNPRISFNGIIDMGAYETIIEGIEDHGDERIIFYPNPVLDFLHLIIIPYGNIWSSQDFFNIEISDLNGKVFLKQEESDTSFSIDLTDLPNGIYILSISNYKIKKITKKIVKL